MAGVVALVLSLNKNLTVKEVKDVLRRACDRIDVANGAYDPATGHSLLYGYGRLNAEKAVKLAVAAPIVPAGGGGAPDATRRRSRAARRGAAAGGGKAKGRRRPTRASSGKSRRAGGGTKRRRSS